ncbi:MAG: UDP-N-acetylmuramoyl-L-alanyl-D-glutamate--2,6-diaminopimelate ligase [Anaerosolibacter sp.]|jgi:UDP-N-acetylmuramoyl-L-alanyl-D-glutamate--2,6-diaminopimelate ligase|uniref:UDP-N-acetylmuramoyl-L-alanyl-D-glutamate--2, 6-diaminopimelate ligase n=1 Tax=Anaerosolibacter sp. TaxID=1872527 RepID=UPI00262FE7FE|nr:UDP-N-acetylmuramoyl-L-alanyl-D-glutamate--2,6-diaminopimelate ligase [Anaerosolibacter sp.]MDF2546897.1 UDP-N-acetylmuramoyl-L-alanyl-D-glutamate--2,6-diaminopimelate ligase [Anaerosolibacter sp.]
MKLIDVIKDLDIIHFIGDKTKEIHGIAYDSRKVDQDYIFVCIEGLKTDGHQYIPQAIEKGAAVIVVEKDVEVGPETIVIKVESGRKALSKLGANFYGNPSNDMRIIGVTGTNGKTTTTHLIKDILEKNHVNSGLIGTLSYKILDKEYTASNTTPESLELHRLFHEMKMNAVDTCTMEVSSHSLELGRVADVAFQIGVFTNLTPDHMDFHGNTESYKRAKTKLFYQTTMANIINVDDTYGKEIAEEIKGLKTQLLTYGVNEQADIYAKNIQTSPKGTEFTLVTPLFSGDVKIKTPGMFSVYNALAAIGVCYVLNFSFDQIKDGLESFYGVSGRFELVPDIGDHTIVVDYAHTPDALENVLRTIKGFATGRIITVFGCGGDRDKTKRPMMGEIAGNLSDYCVITSDNPRTEEPQSILNDIEIGIKRTNCKYKMILDRKEAIREAIRKSEKSDIVLIAGKGHETYQIIGNRTIDFDDKKIAQEILREEIE